MSSVRKEEQHELSDKSATNENVTDEVVCQENALHTDLLYISCMKVYRYMQTQYIGNWQYPLCNHVSALSKRIVM